MTAPDAPLSPWVRWGWLMGGIWVVFLMFPVGAVLDEQLSVPVTVLALAGIVGFGALYVFGYIRLMRGSGPPWLGTAVLAGLIGLALAVSIVLGAEALGMTPFVVSFAMFSYSWPRAAFVAGGLLAMSLLLLFVSGEQDLWFFVILLPMIFGLTLLIRVLDHYGDRHERLAREMAVVSERDRVARDVHDVLGHSLTAISIKAELAERLLEVDPARAARELSQVQTLARDALAEIRSTVAGLRATRIDDELEVARDTLAAAGIAADLPADGDAVAVNHRIVLAWALRESVTNVLRHSKADRCVVRLGPSSLTVTDDGVGVTGPEGNGLRGLRERVAASGGTVSLKPGPDGRGHELQVQL